MSEPLERHPLVPACLLDRFADGSGRVMMERRDRTRKLLAGLEEALGESGYYTVAGDDEKSRQLARLLRDIGGRAAAVIAQIVAGAFPPRGGERAALAWFIALHLLLGRGPRAAFLEAVGYLDELVGSSLPEDQEDEPDGASASPTQPEDRRADVLVHDDEPHGLVLSVATPLARLLAGRTWQLARFPRPQLLTGDTPAVPWSPSGAATHFPTGLGAAAEVRVPLDARHALILARAAPAGELIRDLGDRHASALNRTVADAARKWVFYHPDSDPLSGVALDPA